MAKSKKTPASIMKKKTDTSPKVKTTKKPIFNAFDDNSVDEDVTPVELNEEPPVIEEVKVVPKVLETPTIPEQPNTKLLTIQKHLDEYKILHNAPVITNNGRKDILKKFYLILRFVINNPQEDVLDELYKFFRTNRHGILAESVVFQGISTMSTGPRIAIETFYTLFISLVETKTKKAKFVINLEAVRGVLKNDAIITYVATKLNR